MLLQKSLTKQTFLLLDNGKDCTLKQKPEKLLEDLKQLAEQIGVEVIIDKGNFSGGFCLVYEQRKIVLNRHLPPEIKVAKLAQSLAHFPLEDLYMKPALREYIESEKARAAMLRSLVQQAELEAEALAIAV